MVITNLLTVDGPHTESRLETEEYEETLIQPMLDATCSGDNERYVYKQKQKKDKPTQPKVSVKIKAKGSSALSLLKRIGRAPNNG